MAAKIRLPAWVVEGMCHLADEGLHSTLERCAEGSTTGEGQVSRAVPVVPGESVLDGVTGIKDALSLANGHELGAC